MLREDLRNTCVCSVDPPGCTDIDDALHYKSLPNGNCEVSMFLVKRIQEKLCRVFKNTIIRFVIELSVWREFSVTLADTLGLGFVILSQNTRT